MKQLLLICSGEGFSRDLTLKVVEEQGFVAQATVLFADIAGANFKIIH